MTDSQHKTEIDHRSTLDVIGETLCPPWHREGWVSAIVGQPMRSGDRRVCGLHSTQARAVLDALTTAGRLSTPGTSSAS